MNEIREGLIKRLHVDRRVIAQNRKYGYDQPPITIQTSRGPIKCRTAKWNGPTEFIYNNDKPLSCGARLWIETKAKVIYE